MALVKKLQQIHIHRYKLVF